MTKPHEVLGSPSPVLFRIFPESVEPDQTESSCVPAGARVALICIVIQSGRWRLFLVFFPVLLDEELGYSVFLQFVPERLLCPSPCVFLQMQITNVILEKLVPLQSDAIILLHHLPASPAQTYRAAHELFPSYPVTLLRILSFFVGQRAFVQEKITVWAPVAAVWLWSCDNQRLGNRGMDGVAEQVLTCAAAPCHSAPLWAPAAWCGVWCSSSWPGTSCWTLSTSLRFPDSFYPSSPLSFWGEQIRAVWIIARVYGIWDDRRNSKKKKRFVTWWPRCVYSQHLWWILGEWLWTARLRHFYRH